MQIIIIPASKDVPIFVQYDDLDLTDPDNEARAVAHALNRTAQISVEPDPERVLADIQAGLDLDAFYSPDELAELEDELKESKPENIHNTLQRLLNIIVETEEDSGSIRIDVDDAKL